MPDDTLTRTLRGQIRDVLLAGSAVVLPVLATALVVVFTVSFLSGLLDPVVGVLQPVLPADPLTVKLLALALVVGLVVLAGVVVERIPAGDVPKRHVDGVIGKLPVIGTVYASFMEVSEAFLRPDEREFESVKLVEIDVPDRYAIGFVTSETPEAIRTATECPEMETLFVPSAPNPLVGGDVVYVSSERVVDVDMTVEEGIRAVLTSGAADETGDLRLTRE
jgi:uncharacterized membrane protein